MSKLPFGHVSVVGARDGDIASLLAADGVPTTPLPMSALAGRTSPAAGAAHVLVVDVRDSNTFPEALGQLKRDQPQTAIVLVAASYEPRLMLDAMRAGVTECLIEPLEREALHAALVRVGRQPAADPPGLVLAVVGAKGGVGTTTVAVNLATELEKEAPGQTLLVDLHPSHGDAAVMLGAEPRFSVLDALENTHRLDASMLRGLVTPTRAGVHLLASADRPPVGVHGADRVKGMLSLAARLYRYVVVDLPSSGAGTIDAIDDGIRLIVVANQELSTIRHARRLVTSLQDRHGKDRVSVVVSRFDPKSEIRLEDIEKVVKCRIRHSLPSDYRLALRAQNVGRPLTLDNHNRLAAAFRELARDLAGLKATQPPGSTQTLFGRLSGRRS